MQSVFKELWFQVMVAMVLGVVIGILLSPSGAGLLHESVSELTAPWIALPGKLFLSLIKMVVIPLVLTSIIIGITSSEDTDFLKKVSIRIFPYFICTTLVATIIGCGMALFVRPGKYIDSTLIKDVMESSPVNMEDIGVMPVARATFIMVLWGYPFDFAQDAIKQAPVLVPSNRLLIQPSQLRTEHRALPFAQPVIRAISEMTVEPFTGQTSAIMH